MLCAERPDFVQILCRRGRAEGEVRVWSKDGAEVAGRFSKILTHHKGNTPTGARPAAWPPLTTSPLRAPRSGALPPSLFPARYAHGFCDAPCGRGGRAGALCLRARNEGMESHRRARERKTGRLTHADFALLPPSKNTGPPPGAAPSPGPVRPGCGCARRAPGTGRSRRRVGVAPRPRLGPRAVSRPGRTRQGRRARSPSRRSGGHPEGARCLWGE